MIAGFATPGPGSDIEQQAFRAFARDKTVFFNVWLIVCWFFVWEAADFIGALASSYDYSIIAGRVTGFLITGILLLLATIVLDEIIDEILINKNLEADVALTSPVRIATHELRVRFAVPRGQRYVW